MAFVEPVASVGPARRYRSRSPVTGEPLREWDAATPDEVRAAVATARAAQAAWAATPLRDRVAVMDRALALLLDRQEAYIDRIVEETGRSRLETVVMEIFPACDALNYWSRAAPRLLRDRRVGLHLLRHKSARIHYRPMGVVGVITPWNGPFILSLNPTVQALLAGNAVVVKPSEVTPWSAKLVEELLTDAGLPAGLCRVLPGDGATGAALCEAGVDKISFTGSVTTGRKVGEACGRNLVACTLELGGKDAMIVCADANLERAAGGALFGGLMNAGQFCSGTERVYVVASVADAFEAKVIEKARALTQAREGAFDIGPFIFPKQRDIVEGQLADAVAQGATVAVGGGRNEAVGELYFQPTIVTGATHAMTLMTEETFGPVVPIVRVADEEEAIRMANDSRYGLGATVWTRDTTRGIAIAKRLNAGSVVVNDTAITYGALEVPFGGVGESGVGSANGEGPRNFSHAQPILADRLGLATEQVWYPYTADKLPGLQKALRVLWGTFIRFLLA